MNYFFTVVLALVVIIASPGQIKQFENREQLWLGYFNQTRITKRSGLWAEAQLRLNNDFVKEKSVLIAPRLGYTFYLTDQSRLTAGYAYVTHYSTTSTDTPEHRPWQQIQWTEKKKWFTSTQWFRFEQRFRHKTLDGRLANGYSFNFRARYNFSMSIPLKGNQLVAKTPFALVSNETFINFGKNIVNNYFDQNRAFAGIGYYFTPMINAQLGYLYVFQQLPEGNKYLNIHAIRLYLFHNIDLRAKGS